MDYKRYKKARDAAWRALLQCHVKALPVDVMSACHEIGAVLCSYHDGAGLLRIFGLTDVPRRTEGFTKLYRGKYYIFYRPGMTRQRTRFTVAHEMGHIFLSHLSEGAFTTRNREPEPSDRPIEQEANIFASRFLAPAGVLHAMGAETPEQISQLCGISLQSAQFRAQRLQTLNQRNRFGVSALEREVMRQFSGYLSRDLDRASRPPH